LCNGSKWRMNRFAIGPCKANAAMLASTAKSTALTYVGNEKIK